MQQRDDEQDDRSSGEVRLNASGADSGLMFRQGLELVTAVATRLRQMPGPHCAWQAEPPQAHRMLLTLAMELNSALQLLRAAEEGHLSAGLSRREAAGLLQRLKTLQSDAQQDEETADPPSVRVPPLLQLPAHQLAGVQAALMPHLAHLAETPITAGADPRPNGSPPPPRRAPRTKPALHLVPQTE